MYKAKEAQIFNEGVAFGANQVIDHKVEIELRDRFAAAALTGLLSDPELHKVNGVSTFARDCYKMADAMLEARKK